MKKAWLLLLALACVSSPTEAQECGDYESCAMRLKRSWTGMTLVAGAQERKLTGINMFPSSEPGEIMAQRSEIAAEFYRSFRSQYRTGALINLVGVGVGTAGIIMSYDSDTSEWDDTQWGLIIGGAVVSVIGNAIQNSAKDKASRAVWEYNRTFSKSQSGG